MRIHTTALEDMKVEENNVYMAPVNNRPGSFNYYIVKMGRLMHVSQGIAEHLCFTHHLPLTIIRR